MGREREGRGKGGREGRDPQGLGDTPHFQILKNTLTMIHYTRQKDRHRTIKTALTHSVAR